ncbi:MAG: ABC transporter ATP-binding protein, partial [Kiloniellales bacterium]|nr:ABC transporter ATP-binding protein [Kiloniellales bacterium]
LDDMVSRRGTGLILISHDLTLVASYCDRVLIMYAGRVVESCAANRLADARHPYTRGLLNCLPKIDEARDTLATLDRDPSWASEAGPSGGGPGA